MVQLSEKSDKNIVGPNFFDLKLFWVMCTGFQRPEHKCFCLSTLLLCCREKSSYYKRILLLLLWLLLLLLFCFREKSSYYKRTYGHWSGLRPPPWALSTEIKWLEIFYLFIYPNKIQKKSQNDHCVCKFVIVNIFVDPSKKLWEIKDIHLQMLLNSLKSNLSLLSASSSLKVCIEDR